MYVRDYVPVLKKLFNFDLFAVGLLGCNLQAMVVRRAMAGDNLSVCTH